MADKYIEATADTGQTLYVVIRREADGWWLDDADGSFSPAPADHFLALTEDATVKGYYSATEGRVEWDDGDYSILPYVQTGGSPATAADIPGEARQMVIRADAEVHDGTLADSLAIIDSNVDIILSITSGTVLDQLLDVREILRRIKMVQDKLQLLVLSVEKQSKLKV